MPADEYKNETHPGLLEDISYKLTNLIQLSLLNVLEVSVAISKPTISTAFASNPYLLTKSSLARTAAAAPSDVGQHCSLVRGPNILGEFMICSKVYSTWNWEFLEK